MTPEQQPGRFCWLDLAALDSRQAAHFYAGMFGWQTKKQRANGGDLLRFMDEGESVASLYQLRSRQIAGGVPSHWTPYVGVSDVNEAVSKAVELGGQVVVKPFAVDSIASVSLITDSVGALVGLWELPR